MLVNLLPDQVARFWDIIKYAIEESLPPVAGEQPDRMDRVLTALLDGRAQCWASYTRGDTNKFEGIAVTRITHDDVSDTKHLLLYCLYGYEDTNKDTWFDGFETLKKWGISKGCVDMIAYSAEPKMISLTEMLGGNSEYRFVSIPFV